MSWLWMLIITIVTPVVQPVVQQSVQNVQTRIQQMSQPQQQQQQPYITYHEGRWWKFEGGQWYVWQEGATNVTR